MQVNIFEHTNSSIEPFNLFEFKPMPTGITILYILSFYMIIPIDL